MTALGHRRRSTTLPVLAAYDGSPAARRALLHAAELAGPGGEVTVIHVIPVQSISARVENVSGEQRAAQDEVLREAETLLAKEGVSAQLIGEAGEPLVAILAAAERLDIGTLVVGRAGRQRFHSTLGDVLVRRASCDVLVVH